MGPIRQLVRNAPGSVADTVLENVDVGYDMVVIGERTLRNDLDGPLFSETIDRVVQETPCPTMVVSTSKSIKRDPRQIDEPIRRILLPTVGTQASRHAAEVAFTIAAEENALVEVAHVIDRPNSNDQFVDGPDLTNELYIGDRIVDRDAELGRQLGAKVVTTVTVSDKPGAEIVDIADRNGADVIVMGANT